jgi:hypothetical protein
MVAQQWSAAQWVQAAHEQRKAAAADHIETPPAGGAAGNSSRKDEDDARRKPDAKGATEKGSSSGKNAAGDGPGQFRIQLSEEQKAEFAKIRPPRTRGGLQR